MTRRWYVLSRFEDIHLRNTFIVGILERIYIYIDQVYMLPSYATSAQYLSPIWQRTLYCLARRDSEVVKVRTGMQACVLVIGYS